MKKAVPSTFSLNNQSNPLFIILSGPSGVGKDAVLAQMRETGYPLKYITTVTTRPQRFREKDTIDYKFVSVKRFKEMIKNDELLEQAEVYGNWYGVPKGTVREAINQGQDAVVKVDVQGAVTLKKIMPQAVFVFVMPPSMEELKARLKQRRTESSTDLDLRFKTAEEEIKQLPLFDYIVVNQLNEVDRAVAEIEAIITAEKCRVTPREITLSDS